MKPTWWERQWVFNSPLPPSVSNSPSHLHYLEETERARHHHEIKDEFKRSPELNGWRRVELTSPQWRTLGLPTLGISSPNTPPPFYLLWASGSSRGSEEVGYDRAKREGWEEEPRKRLATPLAAFGQQTINVTLCMSLNGPSHPWPYVIIKKTIIGYFIMGGNRDPKRPCYFLWAYTNLEIREIQSLFWKFNHKVRRSQTGDV